MTGLASELDAVIKDTVVGLREFGYSWTEIANHLGTSRQTARQRWNDRSISKNEWSGDGPLR